MRGTRGSVRRSRLLVASVVVVLAGAAAAAFALSNRAAKTGSATTTTTTTAPATTTTSSPHVTAIGTYSVATTSLTVTVAGLPPTDDLLPTTVWYPVVKPTPANRRVRRHRFPLLVFSQGYAQPVTNYSTLIVDWASAGFVVAGPTYPHTVPSTPTTLDRSPSELGHHPADLRAVITTLLDAGRQPGSVLSGEIDPKELGLVGHSDGGDVSLAVADNTCCRWAGVKATAILSGAEYGSFGGRYFTPDAPPGPPLLVVQGNDDPGYNPPVCSAQLYDAATPPKYYLDLIGATHLRPYQDPTSWEPVVAAVTTDFFDAELAGETAALTRMTTSGDVANVAQLTSGAVAPPAAGTCPTAPGTPTTTPTTAPPVATTTTTTSTTSTTTTIPPSPSTTASAGASTGP